MRIRASVRVRVIARVVVEERVRVSARVQGRSASDAFGILKGVVASHPTLPYRFVLSPSCVVLCCVGVVCCAVSCVVLCCAVVVSCVVLCCAVRVFL